MQNLKSPLAWLHYPLKQLANNNEFIARHIGPNPTQQQAMLAAVGFSSLEDMVNAIIPKDVLTTSKLPMQDAESEAGALAKLGAIAQQNTRFVSLYGCGYNQTRLPAVLLRNVLENPNWYTPYTPYQAEISQGRLEILLNFQQMIIELSGLPLANASLLDEATAVAEAVTMAKNVNSIKSTRLLVQSQLHPQTIALLNTRCEARGIEIHLFDKQLPEGDAFAMLVQYPDTSGALGNPTELAALAKSRNITPIAVCDPLALMLVKSPAELGFSIAVGTTQRFGIPMGYGGPHAAFLACEDIYKRAIPGRLVGVTKDARGKVALRMALQTREQHIKREKATSNICTAQVLLAILSALYVIYHGKQGMLQIALRVHRLAKLFAAACKQAGFNPKTSDFFDTIEIDLGDKAQEIAQKLLEKRILVRQRDNQILISTNATTTCKHLCEVVAAMGIAKPDWDALDAKLEAAIPVSLQRSELPLNHPVFARYTNENSMMRYLKTLQDKDLALTHSMIPLGSCTMKLNAASELQAISWPEFGDIHPFAPASSTAGYARVIDDIQTMLCQITGFDAVSVQPNSGAQGEYAGLLAIYRYHHSKGESQRKLCLIPSSAHGTNPASAVMAGMQVEVVKCDQNGNIDIDNLKERLAASSDKVGAFMLTYPSTHGVFENNMPLICSLVHQHGGRVYMDGANTNALIGMVRPAQLGVDVMHFNLHKTFCIPHGGGGPGSGPIGVVKDLAPFLPGHPASDGSRPVSAAPYGSALILTISWMYMRMMGGSGLTQASKVALLNANYIAKRLSEHYSLLFTGSSGMVAHECIIDIRPIKEESGISEEDIAKRLMDYGFHAPTMSFPVVGTLMIEPTECETLDEIERFCLAMVAIRGEIQQVSDGVWSLDNNPLVNAPHTCTDLIGDWQRPYSRELACFPLAYVKEHKFWPSINRVDNVHGDRNLVCSCAGLEAYAE